MAQSEQGGGGVAWEGRVVYVVSEQPSLAPVLVEAWVAAAADRTVAGRTDPYSVDSDRACGDSGKGCRVPGWLGSFCTNLGLGASQVGAGQLGPH